MATIIPSWQLYGENSPFPDLLHIERIADRAAGLDWQIAPHRHLQLHQMFLILSGQVTMTLDGAGVAVTTPALMNIPRGTVHGFGFAAGTDGFVLSLPAGNFPEAFGDAPVLSRAFVAPATEGMTQSFAGLAANHTTEAPLRRLRLRALTLTLAAQVAEAAPPGAAPVTGGDPRVAGFEALVRRHLTERWQVADYAGALSMSERHLRRLCRDSTGVSARGFIEALRLREACRLLAYTRMQVQEAAFATGFDDPAYFARTFRRATGLSPRQYRERTDQAARS